MVKPLTSNDQYQKARQPSLVAQNKRFISVTSPTTEILRGVWIESINIGTAVGNLGTILNFDGDVWTLDPNSGIITTNQLNKVQVNTLDVIGPNVKGSWAVGNYGTIIYYNTTTKTWTIDAQSEVITTQNLNGILIYDSNALVISVGANGTILTWDGTTWSLVSSGTTEILRGIAYDNNGDLWICGNSGILLKSTDLGVTWTAVSSGTTKRLNYIWFSLSKDWGYAVGDDGIILKIIPSTNDVRVMASGLPDIIGSRLLSFELTSDTSGYIIGNSGNILYFDGTDFYIAPSPTSNALADVCGTETNVIFAVGVDGLILKLQSNIYATAIESRGKEITPLKEEYEEKQILTNQAITDTNPHNSSIFNSSRYKYNTFYIANTLNQSISVQVMANRTNSTTGAVTLGLAFTVAATTGIEAKTKTTDTDGYLPYYYLMVTASVAPASGSINAYVIGRN